MNTRSAPRTPSGLPSPESSSDSLWPPELFPEPRNPASPDLASGARVSSAGAPLNEALAPPPPERPPPPLGCDGEGEEDIPEPPDRVGLMPSIQESPSVS